MDVYLFSDYLASINGPDLSESKKICEIDELTEFTEGVVKIQGKLARICMFGHGRACIEYIDSLPKADYAFQAQNITCPHCGNENNDSWDASESEDEEECDTCGSTFSYHRNVEVTYSSKIVSRNEKVTILK